MAKKKTKTTASIRALASSNTSWDSQIEDRAAIEDLDESLIERFIEDINRKGRRRVSVHYNWQEALEKLELLNAGKPTRAAVLLFGKDVRRFYPSAYIKAGRFRSQTDIVDDNVFAGPLFEQLEKTTIWFKDRLSRKFIIDEPALSRSSSFQRQQEWEYPLITLREAIVNAICHRDYKADADTTIKLFDDQLEIWNAGTLPPDLTPTDLLKPHKSYPHNKLIAQAFYNTEIIEQWGSGTMRMAEALKQQNLPAPRFDTASPYTFKLTLYRSAPQIKLALELNDRQRKALEYLRHHKKVTNVEYQELCNASRATASRDLADLAKKKLVIKRGSTGIGTEYMLSDR